MRRRLWIVSFLAVALVAGCGVADTSDAPPEEAERTEGAEEVAPDRSAETTAAETTRLEETHPQRADAGALLNYNCASFDMREDAQARLDEPGGEAIADEVRQVLDANGNGVACDEPGSNVGADARLQEQRDQQYSERVEITAPEGSVLDYEVVTRTELPNNEAEIIVSTEATSEEDMRLVAEDLRFRNQQYDAFTVGFARPGSDPAETGSGGVRVFNTREAALRATGYTPEEVDRIFREDAGILVLSTESITQEMCAEWTPEDYEALGPPPEEWNCEQYR